MRVRVAVARTPRWVIFLRLARFLFRRTAKEALALEKEQAVKEVQVEVGGEAEKF